MVHDRTSTSTATNDSDFRGIAAKLRNVTLHPFKRCALIQKTNVRVAVLCDLCATKESIRTKPILYRNVDQISVGLVNKCIPGRNIRITKGVS